MRNNENGRSMVEMLGVLAIIGVLSAGGLAGYSKAMFKHKLNTTMEQITMLVTNIRTHFGTQRNYSALSEANLISLGVIPAVMGKSADKLKNPFKGSVAIGKSHARSTDTTDTAFTVTYSGLPKEACIALATADFGSGAGSGFIGVVVGTKALDNAASPGAGEAPLNLDVYIGQGNGRAAGEGNVGLQAASRGEGQAYKMSDAITACSSENNVVSWKFY
jgi:Tfp pilus assembly protein PilE